MAAVAKHHDTGTSKLIAVENADELLTCVQTFVQACRTPAALEFGEELIPLVPGAYAFEIRSGKVWLDIWHGQRSISRRLLAIERRGPGSLECTIYRFGGVPGKLTLLDTSKPQTVHKRTAGERHSFGEQFRRMLFRQFPAWDIRSVSAGMDLQRSFSSVFPRARLTRGQQQIAAMATPNAEREPELLTFSLLWFHHLASRADGRSVQLCLFLPEDAGALTAHRLRWLADHRLRTRLFRFNQHGSAGEVDPQDLGNLDTRVSQRFAAPVLNESLRRLLSELTTLPGIGICPELSGGMSVRHRGLEFARVEAGAVTLGINEKQQLSERDWAQVTSFALHLSQLPAPEGIDASAERWLESQVRSQIHAIDPSLRETPVHSQVLSFAGADRDLLDLLATTHDGRLAVLELKAAEDIHLPVQALDYWMRIHWHVVRGELDHLFPGIALQRTPPLLRLIAPALALHSTHASVLRYFSPEVDVERIGVNSNWGEKLKVGLRLRGGDDPQSHGGFDELGRLAGNP